MSLYPLSNTSDTKYVTVSNTWARKYTVTSYFTKYTLCTGGAMSLHLLIPVGIEQGCVGCAQCAGGAWGAGALYRVYTAQLTGCADSSVGAWGANVNSWMLPIDLSAAKHC